MKDERGEGIMETVLVCGAVMFVAVLVIPAIVNSTAAQLEEKRALREATQGLADVAIISTRGVSDVARLQALQALMPWLVLFMASVAVTIALAIVAVCIMAYLRQRPRRLSEPLFPRHIDVDTRRQLQLPDEWYPVSIRERDRRRLRAHEAQQGGGQCKGR